MNAQREDNRTDEQRLESALFNYKIFTESEYAKDVPLEEALEQIDDEKEFLAAYLFDIANYFGLPFTNNVAYHNDSVEIGEFIYAVDTALKMAGWVSAADHRKALEEARSSGQ